MTTLTDSVRIEIPARAPVQPAAPLDKSIEPAPRRDIQRPRSMLGKILATGALTVVIAGGIVSGAISANAGSNCTPGYRPCIANRASDVDCYGGSGNGPRYTRPGVVYRVQGADRYGLDADNDHRGCE